MAPSRHSIIRNFVKNQEKTKAKEKRDEKRDEIVEEQSTMSQEDLMKFLDLGNLPIDTVLRNAESHERS